MPERYITYSEGPDEDALRDALTKVSELCQSLSHNKIILHTPGIDSLEGVIEDVFGKNFSERLQKEKYATINEIEIVLHTERLKINEWTQDIVLSVHPTSKMFANLNNLNRAKAIVVVPWTEEERDEWIKTWNPEIIGEVEIEIETVLIDSRLEKLLLYLTKMINLSSGLTHPSDKENTIQLLRLLHKKGFELNPDNIKIWALRNGWNSNAASKLYEIAEGVLKGKKFKTSGQKIWTDKSVDKILDS